MNYIKNLASFPHPVNEYAARSVAALVVILTAITLFSGIWWIAFFLLYGFVARVITGPKLSPFGLIATKIIVPTLIKREKLVPGPPKQFAQAVGVAFSATSVILVYGFGQIAAAQGVLATLLVFASLEAFLGFCAGCFVFGHLMRVGFIPKNTCEQCNNFWPSN
jgi:hypothetical protein